MFLLCLKSFSRKLGFLSSSATWASLYFATKPLSSLLVFFKSSSTWGICNFFCSAKIRLTVLLTSSTADWPKSSKAFWSDTKLSTSCGALAVIALCCSGVSFSRKVSWPFSWVVLASMISVVLSLLLMALLAILSMSKLNSWLIVSPLVYLA